MLRLGLLSMFLLLFVSCSEDDVYLVDDAFKPYVQSFEVESAKRQQAIDFEKKGLIIEFANLKGNTAGLCHYESPIRIEIDREYWTKISGKSGDSLMKEHIIFHELGHGFLHRDHDNALLPNGDWKSMMCGGKDNNRSSNINYRGVRRQYYIDELFDSKTNVPDFTSDIFSEDTTGFTQQLYLSFDTENKEDAGWSLVDNEHYKMSIDDKQLRFDSHSNLSYIMLAHTKIDVLSDFIYELSFTCQTLSSSSIFGLILGNNIATNISLEYMSVNNNRNFYMGNLNCYSYYTELFVQAILPAMKNKLKIVKVGKILYYFVNNSYIYCTEADSSLSGKDFGFIVSPGLSLWMDDMRICTKLGRSKALNVKDYNTKFSLEEIDLSFTKINKL